MQIFGPWTFSGGGAGWGVAFMRMTVSLAVVGLVGAVGMAGLGWLKGEVSDKARELVARELSKEGMTATIDEISLDVAAGPVARGIRLYKGPGHNELLAVVDQLVLEVDLAKAWRKEQFLRSLELRNATLILPMDPGDAKSRRIEFKNFNAKVVLAGERLEVRRAEGDFYGLHLSGQARLLLPSGKKKKDVPKTPRPSRLEQLEEKKEDVYEVVRILKRLKFEGRERPQLEVSVEGDLDHPEELKASLKVAGHKVRYRNYAAEDLALEAEYEAGEARLKTLRIRDKSGELRGDARWKRGEKEVPFSVKSTADVPGLLREILHEPALREAVFYEAPGLTAEGVYLLGREAPAAGMPVRVTGRVEAGKFNTHGVVFEGAQADFFLNGEDFFVRDVVLSHRSGALSGQVMRHGTDCRYQAQLRMDPSVFAPFMTGAGTRAMLEKFGLGEGTTFRIGAQGKGRSFSSANWGHGFEADFRSFKYQGSEVKRLEVVGTLVDGVANFSRVALQRPEGEASATLVRIDTNKGLLEMRGLQAHVFPVPILEWFNAGLAREVAKYAFREPPTVGFSGVIGLKNAAQNDFGIDVRTSGLTDYSLTGTKLSLVDAGGKLQVNGVMMKADLGGKIKEGFEYQSAEFTAPPVWRLTGVFDTWWADGDASDYTVKVATSGQTNYSFAGKQLPLNGLLCTVHAHAGRVDITDTTAGLLGGGMTVAAQVDQHDVTAAVQLDRVSFGSLAAVYEPDYKTVGELSGGFSFSLREGPDGGRLPMRGQGRATIKDGNIFALPMLGPLSGVVSAVLPGSQKAYSVARQAGWSFTVQDGMIATKDFEATSNAFVLKGEGSVNYDTGKVDLTARMNVRGPTGILLFPVSKLLEYSATGTLHDPGWHPKLLPILK